MNRMMKAIQFYFQRLSTFWKELSIRGKVNGMHAWVKDESLLQPSRTTLKGLIKLKNRRAYKMHNLFH